jgi:hypothetical protein
VKKLTVFLFVLFSISAFSQVTLKGNMVGYWISTIQDVAGNPRFYQATSVSGDTVYFYDINTLSPAYTIIGHPGIVAYSYAVLGDMNGNGAPELLCSGGNYNNNNNSTNDPAKIIDLKTLDVLYSWGDSSYAYDLYVNPTDNTINVNIMVSRLINPSTMLYNKTFNVYTLGTYTSTNKSQTTVMLQGKSYI